MFFILSHVVSSIRYNYLQSFGFVLLMTHYYSDKCQTQSFSSCYVSICSRFPSSFSMLLVGLFFFYGWSDDCKSMKIMKATESQSFCFLSIIVLLFRTLNPAMQVYNTQCYTDKCSI